MITALLQSKKQRLEMIGEELDKKKRFGKEGRKRWRDEELDEGEGFGLFTF